MIVCAHGFCFSPRLVVLVGANATSPTRGKDGSMERTAWGLEQMGHVAHGWGGVCGCAEMACRLRSGAAVAEKLEQVRGLFFFVLSHCVQTRACWTAKHVTTGRLDLGVDWCAAKGRRTAMKKPQGKKKEATI